jgi:hypothetical protein
MQEANGHQVLASAGAGTLATAAIVDCMQGLPCSSSTQVLCSVNPQWYGPSPSHDFLEKQDVRVQGKSSSISVTVAPRRPQHLGHDRDLGGLGLLFVVLLAKKVDNKDQLHIIEAWQNMATCVNREYSTPCMQTVTKTRGSTPWQHRCFGREPMQA